MTIGKQGKPDCGSPYFIYTFDARPNLFADGAATGRTASSRRCGCAHSPVTSDAVCGAIYQRIILFRPFAALSTFQRSLFDLFRGGDEAVEFGFALGRLNHQRLQRQRGRSKSARGKQ